MTKLHILGVLFIVTPQRELYTSYEVHRLGIYSLVILTNVQWLH